MECVRNISRFSNAGGFLSRSWTQARSPCQNHRWPYEKIRDLLALEIQRWQDELAEVFGGITVSPLSAPYQGRWKYGGVEYIDEIIKVEVVATNDRAAKKFLKEFKERIKESLQQIDILITTHGIQVI